MLEYFALVLGKWKEGKLLTSSESGYAPEYDQICCSVEEEAIG